MIRADASRHHLGRLAAALALAAVVAASPAGAATYYVAVDGNDAGPGSAAQPWRTLQKAGDVTGPGDTVIVRPGTYVGFRPRISGTAQAPVRFVADSGVLVTQPGPSNSNGDNIWVRNVHYVVIEGFEVTGAPRAGIAVQGEPDANATGVVIRGCHCHHNTRWGIFTGFARDLLIEDCETSYSAVEHGIYVSNSGDRPTLRRNHAHHNNASGIQLNADPAQTGDDPDDPQGDGIIEAALIEQNVIHDNGAGGGAAINLASVRHSLIRNNLLFANRASGIAGWDDGFDSAYGTRGNRILGNTIVQPANGRFAVSLKNGSTDNVVLDNVLLHTGTRGAFDVDPGSRAGLQSDYNVLTGVFSDDSEFLTFAEWRAFGFDAHSVLSTAAAVFAGPDDFHLAPDSPARDLGIALPDLPSDLAGTARPQGPAVDAGAYELVVSPPTPTPTTTPLPTVTPAQTGPFQLSGEITYYASGARLGGVAVHLDDAPTTTVSGSDGRYAISNVAAGTHRIEPRRIGTRHNGVSALDAAWVLQHVAGRRSLTPLQRLACDVTASGSLSALDATRILQYTVGALAQLPAATACESDWLFAPHPRAGAQITEPALDGGTCRRGALGLPVDGDAGGLDFDGVLIGDCTGNWLPGAPAGLRRHAGMPATRLRVRRVSPGRLRATLLVRGPVAVHAIEAWLAPAGALRVLRARPLLAARGTALAAHRGADGRIALALAASRPIPARAPIAVVLDLAAPATATLRLEHLRVNE